MDPLVNVERQRELADTLLRDGDSRQAQVENWEPSPTAVYELCELVQALDDWRVDGGFDPYLVPKPRPVDHHSNTVEDAAGFERRHSRTPMDPNPGCHHTPRGGPCHRCGAEA